MPHTYRPLFRELPDLDTEVRARLRLPEEATWIVATARVTRVDVASSATASKPGIGLEFLHMAPADEASLIAYLAELARVEGQ